MNLTDIESFEDLIASPLTELLLPSDPAYISKHFTIEEFTCRCGCGRWAASYRQILCLEIARYELGGTALGITELGGFRCNGNSKHPNWNEMRGGVPYSAHPTGSGSDLYHSHYTSKQLYDYFSAKWPDRYGVIHYPDMHFCHFDTNSRMYRKENTGKLR